MLPSLLFLLPVEEPSYSEDLGEMGTGSSDSVYGIYYNPLLSLLLLLFNVDAT